MNETKWKEIFGTNGLSIELDEHIVASIIKTLFMPDKIDGDIFTNNYLSLIPYVSNNLSPLQIQEFYGTRGNGNKTTSPSISYFLSPAKRAPAFSLWFIAAYPDVMYWFHKTVNELVKNTTGKSEENNNDVADIVLSVWGMDMNKAKQLDDQGCLMDKNRKHHPKPLRILIDSYLFETGKSLEVSTLEELKNTDFIYGSTIKKDIEDKNIKNIIRKKAIKKSSSFDRVYKDTVTIDGGTYVGQLKNGKPHGKGRQVWPDGNSYEGEFKNNMFHGSGVYRWASGEVYEGQWQNNLFHGKGKLYYKNGKSKTGLWREDDFIGPETEDNYNKLKVYETDIRGVKQIQPWPRHLARATDLMLFVVCLLYGCYAIAPDFYNSLFESGLLYPFNLFALISIEALMLTAWGTTPGKYLFAISITDNNGDLLSFFSALSRSFQVYLKGLGLGLPLVSIITLIISYRTLVHGKWGKTTWDYKGGYRVHHDKITIVRKIFLVAIWIGIIISLALSNYSLSSF